MDDEQEDIEDVRRIVARIASGEEELIPSNVCGILLKNANDGTSAYELMTGMFRIRCMNSIVARTGTIDAIKVRHSDDVAGKVIEGTYRVLEEAERRLSAPQDWSKINLNHDEKNAFAQAAHIVRFADNTGETTTSIKPEQLLVPHRSDDRNDDL